MNRRQFERYLRQRGCVPHREGGNHTIWINLATQQKAPVPRHTTLKLPTALKICRLLGIPEPSGQ